MKKILFFIHDLGPGGAEKVLVNLVNNMDSTKFDITVMTLFDVGVNKKYLNKKIRYLFCFKKVFRGSTHLMKVFTPEQLHQRLIHDYYDIEVAYLEGPCARIISGCTCEKTKLVAWIHTEHQNKNRIARAFRTFGEAEKCYNRFDRIVCVSNSVKKDFISLVNLKVPICVLHNVNEYDKIVRASQEHVDNKLFEGPEFKIAAVGKLAANKGFDRLLRIVDQLKQEGYSFRLFLLGEGPDEGKLKKYVRNHDLSDYVEFLGYQENPYKYIAKCDLFVCASYREGFSTAAAEALIVGTAVCTVKVSGMVELLGRDNEYGVITDNSEDALLNVIRKFINDSKFVEKYRRKALERGQMFRTDKTVSDVEKMLFAL